VEKISFSALMISATTVKRDIRTPRGVQVADNNVVLIGAVVVDMAVVQDNCTLWFVLSAATIQKCLSSQQEHVQYIAMTASKNAETRELISNRLHLD
tara:strand:- start:56 stop:346 length:291 start_codon:yes stop_codon:yes gene_type:complete